MKSPFAFANPGERRNQTEFAPVYLRYSELRHDAEERPVPLPGGTSQNSLAPNVCAPGAGAFSGGEE